MKFSCTLLLLSPLLTSLAKADQVHISTNNVSANNDAILHATRTLATLQQWYNPSTGLWDTTGWWNSANILTTLADLVSIAPELRGSIQGVWENTFEQAQLYESSGGRCVIGSDTCDVLCVTSSDECRALGEVGEVSMEMLSTTKDCCAVSHRTRTGPNKDFLNDYYDDEAWWALAWLRIYDLTHQPRYLHTAQRIFADMLSTGYNTTCGGIWWDRSQTYVNAISNELFLSVAASLALRSEVKEHYSHWALTQWEWFQNSGLINAHWLINDGLQSRSCENNNGVVWTYNQGVILGVLVAVANLTGNRTYTGTAMRIADAAIVHFSDGDGILHEPFEPNLGADGPTFKGVFVRNVRVLWEYTRQERYAAFLERNAASLWERARGTGDLFGVGWSGPPLVATAASQGVALDAFVGALAVGTV